MDQRNKTNIFPSRNLQFNLWLDCHTKNDHENKNGILMNDTCTFI